jgi:hypothetical protein
MILRLLSFLFIFHTLLFADTSIANNSIEENCAEVVEAKNRIVKEELKVSFDSHSIVYMLVLTSLLGSFFLKDELADSI